MEAGNRRGYPFLLRPFAPAGNSRQFTVSGMLHRLTGELYIHYRLEGDVRDIILPASKRAFPRCRDLWRQTCFELFFGIPGKPSYWEVNVSPDGCWNFYSFAGYRQKMQEDSAIDKVASRTVRKENLFCLSYRIDLRRLIPDHQGIEVAITGVLLGVDEAIGYWAMDHFGTVPDFHDRRSFLMHLPGLVKM